MVFMLGYIMCNHQDIPELSPDAIKVSDDLSHQISNEMHRYYTYEMKQPIYSNRLVQIIKIIDAAKISTRSAFVRNLEAPSRRKEIRQQERAIPSVARRMESHSSGHSQRPCGVNATKNEGCYQGQRIPD
uniref:NR LBD domain-containing protein n=2 Tax=Acrobeloides nanus TaxID=290746 RepID=A0A914C2H5_9BILA